jgi:hypothetical protein
MMGGDSGTVTADSREWLWDVALSFAGAQRDYVERVAAALKAREIRCFYDADEQIDLWGKYLAEELPAIYGEQAAAAVVFVSADYAARDWTRLERRAALNRAVRERQEYVLPARFDDTPLPGLLSDMAAVDLRGRPPEQFAGMIAAKLAALGITRPPLDGGEVLSSGEGFTRPPGAIRIAEANLRRLGVHAAISAPGVSDEIPPEYVPRDTDVDEHGVRAKVAAAAQQTGFVLLVGGSSVGKTRCAAEAVKALLPDWWLIHPGGPAEVATLAVAPPARTVIWLDELQRYLDSEQGLAGGTVRALLNTPGPLVIIATLWPDRYAAYTAGHASGGPDPRAREREVLDLAAVIRIRPQFTAAEQRRAHAAAARDPRLAAAAKADGYGLTQTLAAAPHLVAWWEDAQETNPYAWAVMTAALDAARLGARTPLTAGFLRAAAPGYCTPAQQAEAPDGWFEQALAYATARLHGVAAVLAPAGAGMGRIAGYSVADYLLQHATWERRVARVPARAWDALLSHIRDSGDAIRLASSAEGRLLYRYAIPLLQRAADAGDQSAAHRLADMLADRGELEELRARADADDDYAAWRLTFAEAEAELRGLKVALTAAEEQAAAAEAAQAGREELEELRARADIGDQSAASQAAEVLADGKDLAWRRTRANIGNISRLADVLADRGELEELRARADAGDDYAASRLAAALADRGELEELRARADAGDDYAASRLADVLADRGKLDELRARADAGDQDAASRLALALASRGELDELTSRGELDGLRDRADSAARLLAEMLADRGKLDELRARANAGDQVAVSRLADVLADRGELEELRARADAGDGYAASRLVRALANRGELEELRARADAGDGYAAYRLAAALASSEDLDQALQLLWAQADAGNGDARQIAGLLTQQGHGEEAERLRRFGLNPDGSISSG